MIDKNKRSKINKIQVDCLCCVWRNSSTCGIKTNEETIVRIIEESKERTESVERKIGRVFLANEIIFKTCRR